MDGTSWDRPTLIEAMRDDDFYYGYLGRAAMSSSNLKKINDSPKEYERYLKYGEDGDTTALVMGNLIHTLVLEPHLQERFVAVECGTGLYNTGSTPETVFVTNYLAPGVHTQARPFFNVGLIKHKTRGVHSTVPLRGHSGLKSQAVLSGPVDRTVYEITKLAAIL